MGEVFKIFLSSFKRLQNFRFSNFFSDFPKFVPQDTPLLFDYFLCKVKYSIGWDLLDEFEVC